MRYRDFHLQLRSAGDSRFCSSVLSSPAGEGEEPLPPEQLPEEWSRESPRSVLREIIGASISPSPYLTPEEIGATLYRALFQGEVGRLFEQSLAETRAQGCGLRLQLILNPNDVAVRYLQGFPWELLFREEFLSLSAWTPVVRSLFVSKPGRDPRLPPGFRVLAAQALPTEATVLKLGQELEEMSDAKSHGDLEIVACRAHLSELRAILHEKGPFDVLHYLGHADFLQNEGALLFETPNGTAERVAGKQLANKVRDFTRLRLLVLNACKTALSTPSMIGDPYGGVAAALVRAGFPVVLAMHEAISDSSAIALSRALYRNLAQREPIEKALVEARHAIYDLDPNGFEWAVPSLFVRTSQPSPRLIPEPLQPREEARHLCEAGLASFWARDYALARQKFSKSREHDPSLEKAKLFDLLAFQVMARPKDNALAQLDDELQTFLAAKDPEVARLAKLALGILRFDISGPQGVRVRGIPSKLLFADLEASQRTPIERDLGIRLGASRDAAIYFNLRG